MSLKYEPPAHFRSNVMLLVGRGACVDQSLLSRRSLLSLASLSLWGPSGHEPEGGEGSLEGGGGHEGLEGSLPPFNHEMSDPQVSALQTLHTYAVAPRRGHIKNSSTFVSLSSKLERNKEEETIPLRYSGSLEK